MLAAIAERLPEAQWTATGCSVELVLGKVKLKRALADADRAGAARIYLVGSDELARGVALERDLASGEQREVSLHDPWESADPREESP